MTGDDRESDRAGDPRPENGTEQQRDEVVAEAALEADIDTETRAQDDAAGELEELRQALEVQTRKATDNLELAQRAQAEMDNLRKRTARDVENAHKYALERFVQDLLPVIDSLELGLGAAESASDVTSLREGMDLTLKKFVGSLEKFGVTVVDPQGEKFNPERHEAVSMTDAEGGVSGTVISVLQKGYELNGRLVRPAMVVVAK